MATYRLNIPGAASVPRIQTVVFDAVGTLIRPARPVAETYLETAERFGVRASADDVRGRFWQAFHSHGSKTYSELGFAKRENLEDAERQRWSWIVRDVFPNCAESDQIFESLWSHFADPRNWSLYGDVETAWNRLRSLGLGIAIASNFDQRLLRIQQSFAILASCKQVFISSQVGCLKPEPEFYQRVSESLGVPPKHLLMIGDHPENDYCAPQRAGWSAVHLARLETPGLVHSRLLASLDQIEQVLS